MNIEKLLQLKKPELQKLADEKGIEYNSKTTNQQLAELIHAKNQNKGAAQAVADALKESDNDLLGDGDFAIVEGQMVKVIIRKNGEVIEGEMSLDELMKNELGTHLALELAVDEKDAALARVTQLEQENTDLKAKNTALELREVATGYDLSLGSDISIVHGHPSSQKPVWSGEAETMKVRVRVSPNKGISNRIRSGMQFGIQYSEHEIDEATFKILIADSHLQVEALNE